MTSAPKPRTPYKKPVLTSHGSLVTVTRATANQMSSKDGAMGTNNKT